MAKKRIDTTIENTSVILNQALEDIMGDRFGRYSKYIIQDRALPDARDGLKPVQRRIVYAMYKDNNTWDRPYRKSAKTVGLVIGNYHPHGDSSVYDAMVRLSQPWKVRVPLVDMHGNNGSIDDDPAAAMRYTEARLASVCEDVIGDIDYNTVLFAPNYDDNDVEPTVLPSKFPTLLVNGAMGIAAGYATNMPPNNLNEIMDACIYRLLNPTCTLEDLMSIVKGPDFPTGGIVQGKEGIEQAFKTGKGKIVIRGVASINELKTINQIIITQIPYEVVKSNMVKRMDEIRINKDIDGILEVRDESDRNGLKVVIDLKKDIDPNMVLNYFYKNTPLQVNYNYNVVAIVNRTPKLLSLTQLLDAFIDHRKDVVTKRSQFLLNKYEARCHIIEGLMHAISIMDDLIATIRQCKDKQDVIETISVKYGFTKAQAEAIANLRLYRLSNTDIVALREEFAQLINLIENLKLILANEKMLNATIVNEFKQTKEKYGSPRFTAIEDQVSEITIDKTMMIANERVMVSASYDGYVKRVSLKSYTASNSLLPGLKQNDHLVTCGQADTLSTLILVSKNGYYGYLPVYKMDEGKWKDIGEHINKYVKFEDNDKIVGCFIVNNFKTAAWLITYTKAGLIKKTPIDNLELSRYSKAAVLTKLKKNDEVIFANICYDNDQIISCSKQGYITRFNLDDITMTAPKGQGVRGIKLAMDDELASACILPSNQNYQYVLIHGDDNLVKRVKLDVIPITKAALKGLRCFKKLKTKANYVTFIECVNGHEVLQYIQDNTIEEVSVSTISIMDMESSWSKLNAIASFEGLLKPIVSVEVVDMTTSGCYQNKVNKQDELLEHSEFEQVTLF